MRIAICTQAKRVLQGKKEQNVGLTKKNTKDRDEEAQFASISCSSPWGNLRLKVLVFRGGDTLRDTLYTVWREATVPLNRFLIPTQRTQVTYYTESV